jgi:hypothetical protein
MNLILVKNSLKELIMGTGKNWKMQTANNCNATIKDVE